ncbi:MAG: hypothetical protein ACJ780_11560 [Solirubrobacteraceae bacterium]
MLDTLSVRYSTPSSALIGASPLLPWALRCPRRPLLRAAHATARRHLTDPRASIGGAMTVANLSVSGLRRGGVTWPPLRARPELSPAVAEQALFVAAIAATHAQARRLARRRVDAQAV